MKRSYLGMHAWQVAMRWIVVGTWISVWISILSLLTLHTYGEFPSMEWIAARLVKK